MRYVPCEKKLFAENRRRLAAQLSKGAVGVFNANDRMPTSGDGTRSYIQQSDFFYLTGIDQEESILLLSPDAKEEKFKEVLFLKETNEEIEIWEGHKLSKEEARDLSGIESVHWLQEFERIFRTVVIEASCIYLNTNEHSRASATVETRDDRFRKWCREAFPLHLYKRAAPLLSRLREVKSPLEIEQIERACQISKSAFRRVLAFVHPGVWEFEIEAEIVHEFIRSRSRGPAFEPIVASGKNACVLHYIANCRQCRKGELILIDFGAEYGNYNADVTRTIPVNGRFTKRQRQVYDAVLRVQRAAVQLLRPGNTFEQYNREVGELMTAELIHLSLLNSREVSRQSNENPLYKRYFMHGISHPLGLDVHDSGSRFTPFAAGMVLTCEPGIYIKEEGIGIRLENDILITDKGPVDLTADIPIEADEIEELMSGRGKKSGKGR